MSTFLYIIPAILILLVMITIHEFGHYIAGKILKFKINEFSVGFGKAIYSKKKKNGEVFSLRVIPLGGYCAFEGEDTTSESSQSFNAQAPWKRIIVLFSGAFFNFISAIFFSVFLLAVIGNGQIKVNEVEGINNHIESLQAGDVVTHANGKKLSYLNGGLTGITQDVKIGNDIKLTVVRDGEVEQVIVQKFAVMEDGSEVGKFGVVTSYEKLSVGNSILQATPFSFQMAGECLVILGKLFIGSYGLEDIGGPITTINAIAHAGAANILNLLLLLPLIAINLAVFNLLPIPALDGARIVFVFIEWIRGKPVNPAIENRIHTIGLFVLLGFVVLVDFLHLFIF